jgi:hypothetical protein
MKQMSTRTAAIISRHRREYGAQRDVAKEFGISRQAVQQIWIKAGLNPRPVFAYKRAPRPRVLLSPAVKWQHAVFWHARIRARNAGIPFSISYDDIPLPERCPILDIPLIIGTGKRTDNSPSLDRKEPSKGYVPGNVAIISWRANRRKSNMTRAEILALAKYVTEA